MNGRTPRRIPIRACSTISSAKGFACECS
jgi:hypothetical protein